MEVVESEALGMEVAELENDAAPTSKAAEPKSATGMAWPGPSASPPRATGPEEGSLPAVAASSASLPRATDLEEGSLPAVAATASKSKHKKIPHKPEKFFEQVVVPKLEAGNSPDITSYLAEWAPERLKAIKSVMRDPTYDVVRAEARTITTSYDDFTIQSLAEHRQG